MEHPFIHDLSSKSIEDLQTTISDLTGKLNFAYRMGNQPMVNQIQMAIHSYQSESVKKMDALLAKQNINSQINIKKEP
jgi:hypothetical protein